MLPIVTDLKDAPEKGRAVLCVEGESVLHCPRFYPVEDRLCAFAVDSIYGWNTTANLNEWRYPDDCEAFGFTSDNESPLIFAVDAATAVARYNEAQPFGEIALQRAFKNQREFIFFHPGKAAILYFDYLSIELVGKRRGFVPSPEKLVAIHALLGEVIQYQKAEASGTRDSRVHRALAEQEKAKPCPSRK